jgi:hypothetical protein
MISLWWDFPPLSICHFGLLQEDNLVVSARRFLNSGNSKHVKKFRGSTRVAPVKFGVPPNFVGTCG